MKISFVIPAYNEEETISTCVRSIQSQIAETGQDAEIIVVNNNSTDNTKQVASSIGGVRVVDEPIKGLSQARHAGYLASTGDIVANIDADDMLPPGWVRYAVKRFESEKDLVALSGPLIYYDVHALYRAVFKMFYIAGYAFDRIVAFFTGSGAMLQGGNYVIRRSTLEAIEGYDTSIAFYGEDVAVARRIAKLHAGKIVWTFRFPMYSSGRRVVGEGLWRLGLIYSLNYTWILLTGKSFTKHYRDIRLPSKQVSAGDLG